MKSSNIYWIGNIPDDWQIGRIKNGYEVTLGKMISPEQTSDTQTYENYLCAANIKFSGVDTSVNKQMWFSDKEKEQYLLKAGDLLIMEGGNAGTPCIYRGEFAPCYIQNSVHRLTAKPNGLNKYLYYFMSVVRNSGYIDDVCNKSTIMHFTKDKVESTPVLFPPLPTQSAIVSYLDTHCAAIDEAISRHKQLIEKLEEYRKSVITQAVTKGLNPNAEMKDTGLPWLGKIPVDWNVIRIKHTSWLKGRIGWDGLKANEFIDEGPYLITGTDFDNGKINWDSCVHITDERFAEDELLHIYENDLLITKDGTIGKLAVVSGCPEKVSLNSGVMIIRNNNKDWQYDTKYMYYVLSSEEFTTWFSLMQKPNSTIQHLYQHQFEDFQHTYPPLPEQNTIASFLDARCAKIDEAIARHKQVIEKLEEYRKSIIYNAVTGKIDCSNFTF